MKNPTIQQTIDELNKQIAESLDLIPQYEDNPEYVDTIASERLDVERRRRTIEILNRISQNDFNRIMNYPLTFKCAGGFSTYINHVLDGQIKDVEISKIK